jgi:hypothetical protein
MLGLSFIHPTNPVAVRDTGAILLAWSALANAAGRPEIAARALNDGIALLEHAAEIVKRQRRLQTDDRR